jgi:hypothetical protein
MFNPSQHDGSGKPSCFIVYACPWDMFKFMFDVYICTYIYIFIYLFNVYIYVYIYNQRY